MNEILWGRKDLTSGHIHTVQDYFLALILPLYLLHSLVLIPAAYKDSHRSQYSACLYYSRTLTSVRNPVEHEYGSSRSYWLSDCMDYVFRALVDSKPVLVSLFRPRNLPVVLSAVALRPPPRAPAAVVAFHRNLVRGIVFESTLVITTNASSGFDLHPFVDGYSYSIDLHLTSLVFSILDKETPGLAPLKAPTRCLNSQHPGSR